MRPFLAEPVQAAGTVSSTTLEPAFDLREFLRRRSQSSIALASQRGCEPSILMLTGIYDLDASVVGVELLRRGVDYLRINAEELAGEVSITCAAGDQGTESTFSIRSEELSCAGLRTVFARYMNLDSVLGDLSLDSVDARFVDREWQAALAVFSRTLRCFWVNRADAAVAASDRLLQLQVARKVGFDIPRTVLTNDARKVLSFCESCPGGVIVKATGHHFVEVRGHLFNFHARLLAAGDLKRLDELKQAPAIFQEYIPKRLEIRVTVVGGRVFATQLDSQLAEATCEDYHRGKLDEIPKAVHPLPQEIQRKCRRLMASMGLVFAGIDLILTPEGRYVFLEINPEASWRWVEVDTGLPITQAVVELLIRGSPQ